MRGQKMQAMGHPVGPGSAAECQDVPAVATPIRAELRQAYVATWYEICAPRSGAIEPGAFSLFLSVDPVLPRRTEPSWAVSRPIDDASVAQKELLNSEALTRNA